ncbi:hypothetical protein L7F22_046337 [Adiantum nelumboides]|nr:hypothetical protein [Adiantum nelumboides]
MQMWLSSSDALLEMMVFHLPYPTKVQRYCIENLYEGPLDDQYANTIKKCDLEGPLMLYVSKMIPTFVKGRFFAFGRVFFGKVSIGSKVRIMGPNYVPSQKKDMFVRVCYRGLSYGWAGGKRLWRMCHVETLWLWAMKFSILLVVRIAVQYKVTSDLPKLVKNLQCLAKSDPMTLLCHPRKLEKSNHLVISKSPNKHNLLYFEARSLKGGLEKAMDEEHIGLRDNPKVCSKILAEEFGFEVIGPNLVVDMCEGVQYLNEIKDSVLFPSSEPQRRVPLQKRI